CCRGPSRHAESPGSEPVLTVPGARRTPGAPRADGGWLRRNDGRVRLIPRRLPTPSTPEFWSTWRFDPLAAVLLVVLVVLALLLGFVLRVLRKRRRAPRRPR
ncbi:hypothetical protein, partial [Arthrobacter sp. 9V]|uniref:hypothetical protein n=1 Tax=Arthrobacter sp. 9V TaxID=2653132 RepID=UPI001358985D